MLAYCIKLSRSKFSLQNIAPILLVLAAGALLLIGTSRVYAQASNPPAKQSGNSAGNNPASDQILYGYPLTITVSDDSQMSIKYSNPRVNQNENEQFYGRNAEGVYLWATAGGVVKVFGPAHVPAGQYVNPYSFVSNSTTGTGTPSDPWIITTVMDVPDTNLRLTQTANYVNGAEFINLRFQVAQLGGTGNVAVSLFHAADLYTAGSDRGYGYHDNTTGAVGDYFTPTTRALFQEFVPSTPATAYQESYYSTIWSRIGSLSGPGAGFNNTIIENSLHDSGAGLQWNLTVPADGSVTVGDTDLFSPHESLCGSFSDVHTYDYYYDYIYYLACRGIVSGYADTTFRPQNNVSRGQLSKIVSNAAGFNDTPTGQIFEDVPPSSTFYLFIERMATRGLISGYPCGSTNPETGQLEPCIGPNNRPYFRVYNTASRGQIAKIVANAAGIGGTPTGQTFEDVPPSHPFYVYIERLIGRGTMGGYACGSRPEEPCVPPGNRPYFRSSSAATRAQTSKIVALTFFPSCCPPFQPAR